VNRPTHTVKAPDGHYAVPDPHDPGRLTFWAVVGGVARDWPAGTRWRPIAPRGLAPDDRDAWYQDVYYPWRAKVAEAIDADPAAAAAAFTAEAGDVDPPERPRRGRSPGKPRTRGRAVKPFTRARRAELALMVAAIQATGKSCRETAGMLGISKSSAHRLGEAEDTPEGATQAAITYAVSLLRAEQLFDQLLIQRVTARGEEVDRVDRMLADVERIREELRSRALAAGREA
jgi:hypothetical protein